MPNAAATSYFGEAPSNDAACEGTCEGACTGQATGTCGARCDGEFSGGECEGTCTGSCVARGEVEAYYGEEAEKVFAPIRFAVFVQEQGVPRDIELDAMDEQCVHAIAFEGGHAIGTGRLLPDGHIGRMAVLKAWRGRGIGGRILEALMQRARERGDPVGGVGVPAVAFGEEEAETAGRASGALAPRPFGRWAARPSGPRRRPTPPATRTAAPSRGRCRWPRR